MKIIGCDFHPSFQQIALVDTETGEYEEKRLTPGEARQFYGQLKGQVVVGMEASGNTLVRAAAGRAGAPATAGGCEQDPGDGGAQAEDRPPRC